MKETIKIPPGRRLKASRGYKQSARAVKLEYVMDSIPGILRTREGKNYQLLEFGKALPLLRARLKKDLWEKELTEKKVLAIMISLMEQTYIRVGNKSYEKLYGSYGLTTLKDKNVTVQGDRFEFSFKGKKGISHRITLRNKNLAKAIKLCRDIPGKELFQYYDPEGEKKCIDSGMLNNYLKESTGNEFTAKDFRTWAGSYQALKSLMSMNDTSDESCAKKILSQRWMK